MSRQQDEEELVREVSLFMLAKLRANKHKQHWSHQNPLELLTLLKAEVAELEELFTDPVYTQHGYTYPKAKALIPFEVADVCNIAAMIYACSCNEEAKK